MASEAALEEKKCAVSDKKDLRGFKEVFNALDELRQHGKLCDGVVTVPEASFPVHSVVLAACSPYFHKVFKEGKFETNHKEIFISDITPDLMRILINFVYTHEAVVTDMNAEDLFEAAERFQIIGLVKYCCEYLEWRLDYDTCLGVLYFARRHNCVGLELAARRYFFENFTEVAADGDEILQLSYDELAELISSDELNAKSEDVVFDCVTRWIYHEVDNRKHYIAKLLCCIRFGLLPKQYFVETVKKHPLVHENALCKIVVIDTIKYIFNLNPLDGLEDVASNPLGRPRLPHDVLFVIGGWSGGTPTSTVETYDIRADSWIPIYPSDKGPRAYHGCATLNNLIYMVGGFDGLDYFNCVRCFNPAMKYWSEVAPMNEKRCYVSIAVLDGYLYAMGGFDGVSRLNTAERYYPSENQWNLITPMSLQRSDASAAALDGKIYIAGGFNGRECLNTAECYDPLARQWTMIAPMMNLRSGVGVVAIGESIYAIGGFNGITRLNNGERYNPSSNRWTNIAEMLHPRSNFGIEVMDGMIFAIGGFDGVATISNVECYDPTDNMWHFRSDMCVFRSALSACVVKGLPNIHEFIHRDSDKQRDKNL